MLAMSRLSCLLVLALAGVGCEQRDTRVPVPSKNAELEKEIEKRQAPIRAEVARLGARHAWAGRYYGGDGLCENVVLWVAPDSGCVATWYGCLGLYGANWGKIEVQDGRLHVAFERPNTPGEFGDFDTDYELGETDGARSLTPKVGVGPLILQQ